MEKEWYSDIGLDVVEVEGSPAASTRNGHKLQFLFKQKSDFTSHLIDLSDVLDYDISELKTYWDAGGGSVEIDASDDKKLEIKGHGCVSIRIYDKGGGVLWIAVQINTWTVENGSVHAWEDDEVTLAGVCPGTVYHMAGSPCAWVCSNAAGVHETYRDGSVTWHDYYEYYKPLVVDYEVVDSTAGKLIDAETATAAELGVFKAYAGKVISQRCRVTAGSGEFKVSGHPAKLVAYPDGDVEVLNYTGTASITVYATTTPVSYAIIPDSTIEKTIFVGESFNVSELYMKLVVGGDGKTHLRATTDTGTKQISLADADGLGTVTGKAAGTAYVEVLLVADTSGDYRIVGGVAITVEEVTVTITGHDRTMRTGKSRALEKFFTVESNTDSLTRSYEWEDTIGTGVAKVTGDKLKALVAGGVGALRLHIKETKTGALFNGLCVVTVADDTGTGCIAIGSDVWEDEDDPIYVGGEAVKAVYVCDEDGNLHQVYG